MAKLDAHRTLRGKPLIEATSSVIRLGDTLTVHDVMASWGENKAVRS